nr:MAG TPA: hypothetical protein [Caudoviricetes sp.]
MYLTRQLAGSVRYLFRRDFIAKITAPLGQEF